jgi:hypothetical protein
MVSAKGGNEPRWTRGGREIVYMGETAMMSVAIDPVTGAAGLPVPLFRITDVARDNAGRRHNYDVTGDGERFLLAKKVERPGAQPLSIIVGWKPDLSRRGETSR